MLGFLRGYYKHRPRSGDIRTETNMRGEGAIIVDSYLSYPDESGDQFIATAEATSVETRGEVQFTIQHRLLFWDSLAFGSLAGFVYVITSYFMPGLSMPGLPPILRAFTILFMIVAFSVMYHSIIRPLRRYRYIYAIAQFKKYHADEQWVALARGVFPNLDKNRYYRELKRQCTRFGFGLVLVENDMQPRLVLSPSREEVFDRRRDRIKLLSLNKYAMLQELRRQNWLVFKWWNKWTDPYREHDYLRFKRGFSNQFSLIGLGVILIIVAFIQERKRMPVYYPNESRYRSQLEQEAKDRRPEPEATDPKPFTIPFGEQTSEEHMLGLDDQEDSTEIIPIAPEAEVMIYDPYNQTIILYDCERMYNFTDTKYIIEIGEYGDLEQAKEDLEILGDAGINGVTFWEGCFSPDREAFIMYLETMHNDVQDARRALDSLSVKLREAGLTSTIRPVTPLIDRTF